jgi:predicted ribosome quality control (RQC) complex YloA/Tae2 family protein
MINFDSLTLSALTEELKEVLIGNRIHRVQQPTKSEILLTIRAGGTNRKLCISAHAKYSYMALLNYSKRTFTNPQQPPMFCMLLRKHMEGAKIVDLVQPENERILEINFESFNELGDRIMMTLACEIMGKYSNIILYITSTKLILGCAHNVGEYMSSQRELAGSLPYVLPPPQDKLSLLSLSQQDFTSMALALNKPFDLWLSGEFHYISLALARELCHVAGISYQSGAVNKLENITQLYQLAYDLLEKRNFSPSLSEDKAFYSLLACDPYLKWDKVSSVNEMVDRYFDYHISVDSFHHMQSNLKSRLVREVKRIDQRINKVDETLAKAARAEEYRQKGDLLMANLSKVQAGQKEVTLENFYDQNTPTVIELDPRLSVNHNAQKYFKLYNKAKNSYKITMNRREQELRELEYLKSVLLSVEQATDKQTLEEIQDELDSAKEKPAKLKPAKKKEKQKISISRFLSSDNLEILVGRNNKQNDYLTTKLAHPADLWVHTQVAHGAHVIIKTDRGQDQIPESTLHEAALLAGYFSEGRYSSNVAVVYTLKKFVKKPAGAKPGFVVYSNEKTLYVNPLEEHVLPVLQNMQTSF